MKKVILIWISVFLVSSSLLNGQLLKRNSDYTTYCYAGTKVNKIYIAPPKEFFNKRDKKGGATITFYYTGFPTAAVTALEYAGSILESLLPAGSHIDVLATWIDLGSSGILAQASTTGEAPGWAIDAFKPFAFYPAALAEKIYGQSLNKTRDGDIELTVNSSINWYLGIDGKTPVQKYDLVTVSIHEMIHGLGFFDSFYVDGTVGGYGVANIPLIYDAFVENLVGQKLTDTLIFPNPSVNLKNDLTSGDVYFNGPLLSAYNSGGRAKLWSPSTFDNGSSISHLDEYATLEANSLMTPYIDLGEAIHYPGKYTFSILGDLGWINTRIVHDPPPDTEEHLTDLTINASVKSDTTYDHNSMGVVWSFDDFTTSDTLYLNSPQSDDNYTATIPVDGYDKDLQYYLFVQDKFLRIFRSPSLNDYFRYTIHIGTDTVKPLITHTPEKYYFESIDSVDILSLASDNIGLDTVYMEYKLNEGTSNYLGLISKGNYMYRNAIKSKLIGWSGGDSLQYRIIAIDKAAEANQKVLPDSGFFSVKVEKVNSIQSYYSTDFSDAGADFFNDGFQIMKPAGFTHYGLNTPHPYISPEDKGDSIGYVSVLRTPVIFDGNGMIITYKEMVLVEPGEAGSVYGTKYFYDYVIVEGSVNSGKTWFDLTDGYDCRYADSWNAAYASLSDGQNSTYVPKDESMLRQHTVFLKESSNLSAGDTLMVRFRLFSDPYANGWGWIIEDLHIGPIINSVNDITYDPVIVYPNPGNGLMRIKVPETADGKSLRYGVYNIFGTCLMTGTAKAGPELELNISQYPSGIYLIVLYTDTGPRTFKYNMIR